MLGVVLALLETTGMLGRSPRGGVSWPLCPTPHHTTCPAGRMVGKTDYEHPRTSGSSPTPPASAAAGAPGHGLGQVLRRGWSRSAGHSPAASLPAPGQPGGARGASPEGRALGPAEGELGTVYTIPRGEGAGLLGMWARGSAVCAVCLCKNMPRLARLALP